LDVPTPDPLATRVLVPVRSQNSSVLISFNFSAMPRESVLG
jgi:hypothetical protein